jgi:hypothetical protein
MDVKLALSYHRKTEGTHQNTGEEIMWTCEGQDKGLKKTAE